MNSAAKFFHISKVSVNRSNVRIMLNVRVISCITHLAEIIFKKAVKYLDWSQLTIMASYSTSLQF